MVILSLSAFRAVFNCSCCALVTVGRSPPAVANDSTRQGGNHCRSGYHAQRCKAWCWSAGSSLHNTSDSCPSACARADQCGELPILLGIFDRSRKRLALPSFDNAEKIFRIISWVSFRTRCRSTSLMDSVTLPELRSTPELRQMFALATARGSSDNLHFQKERLKMLMRRHAVALHGRSVPRKS